MIRCTAAECGCGQQFRSMADLGDHLDGDRRRHKYGVAKREARTYGPVAYHSKTEARRAVELDLAVRARSVLFWVGQPRFVLGDIAYSADFLVWGRPPEAMLDLLGGPPDGLIHWVEDAKGHETERFRLVRRLWPNYAILPLFVLKRKGNRWEPELIPPA